MARLNIIQIELILEINAFINNGSDKNKSQVLVSTMDKF